jgi:hypothetical protein
MATMADGAQQHASMPSTPPPNARSAGLKLETPTQPRFDNVAAAAASVGIMSPVNQNGCFEFDRIIKAGNVVKRTRKTRVSTAAQGRAVTPAYHCTVLEAHLPRATTKLPLHLQGQG